MCCILNACPGTVFDITRGYAIRSTNKQRTHATASNGTYSHIACHTTLSHLIAYLAQEVQKLCSWHKDYFRRPSNAGSNPARMRRQELLQGIFGVLFSGHKRFVSEVRQPERKSALSAPTHSAKLKNESSYASPYAFILGTGAHVLFLSFFFWRKATSPPYQRFRVSSWTRYLDHTQ